MNAPTDQSHRNGQLSEVHGDSCYRSRMVVRQRGCRDQVAGYEVEKEQSPRRNNG